jgi:hypothetical protein
MHVVIFFVQFIRSYSTTYWFCSKCIAFIYRYSLYLFPCLESCYNVRLTGCACRTLIWVWRLIFISFWSVAYHITYFCLHMPCLWAECTEVWSPSQKIHMKVGTCLRWPHLRHLWCRIINYYQHFPMWLTYFTLQICFLLWRDFSHIKYQEFMKQQIFHLPPQILHAHAHARAKFPSISDI